MLPGVLVSAAPISPESSDLSTDSGRASFASLSEPQFSQPTTIGEYAIVGKLGHGGMSEVFLAMAQGPGRVRQLLVIKKLLHHLNDEPELVQMFLDEVRLAAQLTHPNVVQTHRAGSHNGQHYLAMEYLRGQPLSRVIRRASSAKGAPIPPALAARLVADALAGLEYAHTARDYDGEPFGIIHRDISPQNIFVTYEGVVKILDFGIAKASTQQSKTNTGLIKGKFGYIAPEQAVGESMDHRADIWSMGVVFWECLTGCRLFKGRTDAATLQLALTREIPSPTSIRPDIPPALGRIALKALERDVSKRYQQARHMQEDLDEWLAGQTRISSRLALSAWVTALYTDVIQEERQLMRECIGRLDLAPQSAAPITIALPHLTPGLADVDLPTGRPSVRRRLITALALLGLLGGGSLFTILHLSGARRAAGSEQAQSSTPPSALGLHHARPNSVPNAATSPIASEGLPEPPKPAEPAATSAANVVALATSSSYPPVRGFTRKRKGATLVGGSALGEPRDSAAPRLAEPAPTIARESKASAPGLLSIDSTPWSYVSINGKPAGATPVIGLKLEPGIYQVHLKNPELGLESTYPVTVKSGQTATRRFGLD